MVVTLPATALTGGKPADNRGSTGAGRRPLSEGPVAAMKKKRGQAHNHPEMTPQEMARCRPATEVDPLGLPIPTHVVSNDEYFPPFLQTPQQQQVEARVLDALESVPRRVNINRRQFLATSAGLAASFVALNEVFKQYAYGETLFRVASDATFDHHAFLADGPPSDLFVFDDQIHIVRGSLTDPWYAGDSLLVLAQGDSARFPKSPYLSNPWNPENHPDEFGNTWANWDPKLVGKNNMDATLFWLPSFIQACYLESQTSVAIISTVPGQIGYWLTRAYHQRPPNYARNVYETRSQEVLTAEQNFACREFINAVAGSTRALSQGMMYMGPGNLWYLQEQLDRFGVDAWKGYQHPTAKRDEDPNSTFEYWTMDDEALAFPTFAFIRDAYRKHGAAKPGLNCVRLPEESYQRMLPRWGGSTFTRASGTSPLRPTSRRPRRRSPNSTSSSSIAASGPPASTTTPWRTCGRGGCATASPTSRTRPSSPSCARRTRTFTPRSATSSPRRS